MSHATDDDPQDELKKEAERAEEQRLEDLHWLMDQPQGRRFVWWLLSTARVHQSSFNPEALWMAHNEGRRSVGTQVMQEITQHEPAQYLRMIQEVQPDGDR